MTFIKSFSNAKGAEKSFLLLVIIIVSIIAFQGFFAFLEDYESQYYLNGMYDDFFQFIFRDYVLWITLALFILSFLASLVTFFLAYAEAVDRSIEKLFNNFIWNWLFSVFIIVFPLFIFGKTINRTMGSVTSLQQFTVLSNNGEIATLVGEIDGLEEVIRVEDDSLQKGEVVQISFQKGGLGYYFSPTYRGKKILIL